MTITDIHGCTNDKKRFAISEDGFFIRAVQGHSLKTTINYQAITPPKKLFHGTATRFIESIFNQGLIPNGRQYESIYYLLNL